MMNLSPFQPDPTMNKGSSFIPTTCSRSTRPAVSCSGNHDAGQRALVAWQMRSAPIAVLLASRWLAESA